MTGFVHHLNKGLEREREKYVLSYLQKNCTF